MTERESCDAGEHASRPVSASDEADTSGVLLETVRCLLGEENEREQSLNARGVGFAGFVAIVLSLTTALGHTALSTGWGEPWKGIAVALYALALAALLLSVVLVVQTVLRPKSASSLALSEVQRYPTDEYLARSRLEAERAIMGGLIDTLARGRELGQSKARGLRGGCELLLVGLSCIAILGFLVGLRDAGLIGSTPAASRQGGDVRHHPPRPGDPRERRQAPTVLEPGSP